MEYLPLIWLVGSFLTPVSLILGWRRFATLLVCPLTTTAMVAQLVVGEEINNFWMAAVLWMLLTLWLVLDLPAVKRAVGKIKH